MDNSSIGVAVIGAGMAGRSHAQGYRLASTVFEPDLPDVRLVAIADVNEDFATDAAKRYGYARAETSWEAIAAAPDVDAVSIVVANPLHREIAEGLLAAGKHVLCEKPLAPTVADAQAMVKAAEASDRVAAVGMSFRRSPAINAIRDQLGDGGLGRVLHFNGHYWCDYGVDPNAPMSWRYKGAPGTGALADVGSHLVDLSQFLCGPIDRVSGAILSTVVADRPLPVGATVGHAGGEVSDTREPVQNDDVATFTVSFASGAAGTLSVSRVAFGHPNDLRFEVFCENGAATFDLERPAEFTIADRSPRASTNGYRQVLVGPQHPYIARGLPMDFPGVGHGVQEFFTYQARAFLEEIAGLDRLQPCATFADGLHTLQMLDAITATADGGTAVNH